jgi:O-methyltransferase involved in polyketide biosynthesis
VHAVSGGLCDPQRVREAATGIAALRRGRTDAPERLFDDPVLAPFLQLLRPREAFRYLEQGEAIASDKFHEAWTRRWGTVSRLLARLSGG